MTEIRKYVHEIGKKDGRIIKYDPNKVLAEADKTAINADMFGYQLNRRNSQQQPDARTTSITDRNRRRPGMGQ